MRKLTPNQYYTALAWYLVACQKQAEVRHFEKAMNAIVGEGDGKLNDAIYDPSSEGTKEEYDNFLLNAGVTVEWNQGLVDAGKDVEVNKESKNA